MLKQASTQDTHTHTEYALVYKSPVWESGKVPVSGYIHFTWTAAVLLQIVNKQRSRQAKHRELWEAGRERERESWM